MGYGGQCLQWFLGTKFIWSTLCRRPNGDTRSTGQQRALEVTRLAAQRSRQARAVFKASAVYEGDNEDVVTLVPYLVCAVFNNFPGQNGFVRILKFDSVTGAVIKDR